jgi:ABC-type sugar transport system ATPase subunit
MWRHRGNAHKEEADETKIIRLMVGREVGLFPKEDAPIGEPVLEVRNISGANGVKNVSFSVRKGEIVGLAGLVGAGRTEVARLICGADRLTEGSILLGGNEIKIHNTATCREASVGAEDRKQHGLVLMMDVKSNTGHS